MGMRLTMPRFRVRTLMIVVALLALLMGAIGPGRRWHRRWSYHRSQAAVYGRLERQELLRTDREAKLASDRGAIRSALMRSPEFAATSPEGLERAVNATVSFHQSQSKEARAAATRWEEKRQLEETAALWCWDPFAPEVP
jgi:hypothetical protein